MGLFAWEALGGEGVGERVSGVGEVSLLLGEADDVGRGLGGEV